MSDLTTTEFWAEASERAIKTAAQAAITLGIGNVTNLLTFDWAGFITGVIIAGVLSVLTSIASINIGPKGSPSVVTETPAADTPASTDGA